MEKLTHRLARDHKTLKADEQYCDYFDIYGDPLNLYHFYVILYGPKETPYEKGVFKMEILDCQNYPMHPPKVVMTTKIFHPSVDDQGRVCQEMFKKEWCPAINIRQLALIVWVMLLCPETQNPSNQEASELYRTSFDAFQHKAREWTLKYASK